MPDGAIDRQVKLPISRSAAPERRGNWSRIGTTIDIGGTVPQFNARILALITVSAAVFASSACERESTATTARATPTSAAPVPPSSGVTPGGGGRGGAAASASAATGKPFEGGLGSIISTGLDASAVGQWIIYGVPFTSKSTGKTAFGFELSELDNNGTIHKELEIAEITASPLAPGFHAVEAPAELEETVEMPAVGYFVGDLVRITGTVDGRTVTAKMAKWSENGTVTVFWFDNTEVTGTDILSSVSAFDQANREIARATVSY